ncbi:uncharacterized protein SPSK_03304 [Sporothrix schenckii 1099-18]|uniref:HAD-superfamily subfamily IIA hydrolase n=1 Tax=Sporothrix schenckii 1099-18 TaxID=1397361 RepID=A0A0F2LZ11_SPOSC|nr:uncharacterized protein SPSK_03304 [Sporothrix schenckii 1099-18]KJR82698.1 hypothetical protein SPSK_03304 [Sporothrix schenckii 1099-18]
MASSRRLVDRLLTGASRVPSRRSTAENQLCGILTRLGSCAFSHGRRATSRSSWSAIQRQRQRRAFSTPATSSPFPFPPSTSSQDRIPPFAFAFDIDGVLLHVNEPISGAAAALRYLHRQNIPFILLTNGGGRYEADRVADLQRRLGLDTDPNCGGPLPVLSPANFVQSHTPFQELLDDAAGLDAQSTGRGGSGGSVGGGGGLRDQTILVTGSDAARIRTIAEQYGFRSVVTPADILTAYPAIYPFEPLLKSVYAETARPLPKPLLLEGGKLASQAKPFSLADLDDSKYLRIAAAFVFNDPRDWALDIQLLTDLLQARRGFLGTFDPASLSAESVPAEEKGTRLFFSNADLLWATTYHLPRFGQGAFAAAVAGVWSQLASPKQPPLLSPEGWRATLLGKPHAATYRYAERTLVRYRTSLLEAHGGKAGTGAQQKEAPLKTVYMVGDNPDSDIAGANQFSSVHGTDWCSVLVETGVYDPARAGSSPDYLRHRPRAITGDVGAAVRWALQREGWPADF